ncbi:hypothetical protein BGZ47_006243, partial [Haplosporangium gracile]
ISRQLTTRKKTLHMALDLSAEETGAGSLKRRCKRRIPNNVTTTTSSSSFTIPLKDYHPAENMATTMEEVHGTLTGRQGKVYYQRLKTRLSGNRVKHADFIIDLTALPHKTNNDNKWIASSKASGMEQAGLQSDDVWTPAIAARKAAHKAKLSKQMIRARAAAKLDARELTGITSERLACIEIPSNAIPSRPSSGRPQRFLHIDIKTSIKPSVTQVRIEDSASITTSSAAVIFNTADDIDNDKSLDRGEDLYVRRSGDNNASTDVKLGPLDVHLDDSFSKSDDQIHGSPISSDNNIFVDTKLKYLTISQTKRASAYRQHSGPFQPSSYTKPSPFSNNRVDEDPLSRVSDQDDTDKFDASSLHKPATDTDSSPLAIENGLVRDEYSQHETTMTQRTITAAKVAGNSGDFDNAKNPLDDSGARAAQFGDTPEVLIIDCSIDKFTNEYKTKIAALRREDDGRKMMMSATRTTTTATTTATTVKGSEGETWKSNDFERLYGEKVIQTSVRKMEAGDSSKTSLAKVCLNKGIQIGDQLLYVRDRPTTITTTIIGKVEI